MEHLNFCGLDCPQPVIKTKAFLDNNPETDSLTIVVDNQAAVENLTRFLSNQAFTAEVEKKENDFIISGTKTGTQPQSVSNSQKHEKNTLIMITSDTIGSENSGLGTKLMVNFVKTISEMKDSVWRIVFVNDGVKLTVEGAETLPVLQELENDGISILVCGTCLDHYNLIEKKMTGETTNMLDIMTSLQVSGKVINL